MRTIVNGLLVQHRTLLMMKRFLGSIRDPNVGDEDVVYHLYVVTGWSGCPRILDDEHSEMCWLSKREALDLPDLALFEYRALIQALPDIR